jgi:glycosyltransferase involved in cell wall biosynthesis
LIDPQDLAGFGAAVGRLLNHPELAARLGAAALDRARAAFLEPRHLGQWVDIIETLSAAALVKSS